MQTHSLKDMIEPTSGVVRQMARQMRMRPETMFQLLDDAFDKSIKTKTPCSLNEGLHFETDFAWISLCRRPDSSGWDISYKAKEAMVSIPILPHPKSAFTIPDISDILLPNGILNQLNQLTNAQADLSQEQLADQVLHGYQTSVEAGAIIQDENTITFYTGLNAAEGNPIYGVLEPTPYEPIPNTWKLSAVEHGRKVV